MTNGATAFCKAILRHFSYNKYCTPPRLGARRIKQHAVYNMFMKEFMDAVSITNAGWLHTDERKKKLVYLEKGLTRRCPDFRNNPTLRPCDWTLREYDLPVDLYELGGDWDLTARQLRGRTREECRDH